MPKKTVLAVGFLGLPFLLLSLLSVLLYFSAAADSVGLLLVLLLVVVAVVLAVPGLVVDFCPNFSVSSARIRTAVDARKE